MTGEPLVQIDDQEQFTARPGDTILAAALHAGYAIPHECDGNCCCLTCHVYIVDGASSLSPMDAPEQERLSSSLRLQANSRLACQALLTGGKVGLEVAYDEDEWT